MLSIPGSGKVRQITRGQHDYTSIQRGSDSRSLTASRMSMSSPAELYRVDVVSGKAVGLTSTNRERLRNLELGKVEERWVDTTDGKRMLVWVIFPPDFDPARRYPTILYCQGGPQSTVSQFFSYRWNFQIMAANGYIVVAPNRRGLPSFGQAWNDAIAGDWGGQAMQDYLSAIDHVAAEPYVDQTRLGAVGASFGGLLGFLSGGTSRETFQGIHRPRRSLQPGKHVRGHRGDILRQSRSGRPLLARSDTRELCSIFTSQVCPELGYADSDHSQPEGFSSSRYRKHAGLHSGSVAGCPQPLRLLS